MIGQSPQHYLHKYHAMILRLLAGYRGRPTDHLQTQLIHLIHFSRGHRLPHSDPGRTGHQQSPAIVVASARLSLVGVG